MSWGELFWFPAEGLMCKTGWTVLHLLLLASL